MAEGLRYRTKKMKIHGEIQKVEEYTNTFTDKAGKTHETKAIILQIKDDDEERFQLVDKSSESLTKYKKGQVGTFTLSMLCEEQFGLGHFDLKMYVGSFEEDEDK